MWPLHPSQHRCVQTAWEGILYMSSKTVNEVMEREKKEGDSKIQIWDPKTLTTSLLRIRTTSCCRESGKLALVKLYQDSWSHGHFSPNNPGITSLEPTNSSLGSTRLKLSPASCSPTIGHLFPGKSSNRSTKHWVHI